MRGIRFAPAARVAGILIMALALILSPGRDAVAATGSHPTADRILLPSAGWNGRAIHAPHRHETVRTAAGGAPLRGWSAGPVRHGAGFGLPGGSDRVREVQRRLARLGYHVGPIDGLFGRLTRASVAWFQVKHGLPVTGRATLTTVRHLRARTTASRTAGSAGANRTDQRAPAASQSPAWEAFRQLVGPRVPVPGGRGAPAESDLTRWMLALLALDLALLIALVVERRSRTVQAPAPEQRAAPRTHRFAPPAGRPVERPSGGVPASRREGRP